MIAPDPNECPLGDSHNFGRRVTLTHSHGLSLVRKPRSIFWEHLFLDSSSRFRSVLRKHSNADIDFDKVLGHVESRPLNRWFGESRYLAPGIRSVGDLQQVGALCAVALVFGWTDLHRDNQVFVDGRLHIIDLECVFWDLQLPSETLLTPGVRNPINRTIFGEKPCCAQDVKQFLFGYLKTLSLIDEARDALLDELKIDLLDEPIRIILRHTRDYNSYLSSRMEPELMLLVEEHEQLKRGDIPYFWGYCGDQDVWYFKEPDCPTKLDQLPLWVTEKVNRAFKTPTQLLSRERIERLKRQGMAEVAYRMVDWSQLPIECDDFEIRLTDSYLKVSAGGLHVQTVVCK